MLQKTLSILIADDDEGDRKQIKRALKQSELPVTSTETASIREAMEACEQCAFDCAIVDYRLPGQDGLAGVTALHARLPNMAIVMMTGQGDEMVATEAMKRGASDYMPKKLITPESMRRCIENAVEKAILVKTVAQQREELEVFSRVLVHDLKSPLCAALGFAGLVEDAIQSGTPKDVASWCNKIVKGLERMNRLIDTLHSYTTAEAPIPFETLAMQDVMTDTLSNLEHLVGARHARVTYGDLPSVSGTAQLTQLLQNLIGNGIKYCKAEIPLIHVTAQAHDEHVWLFSVKDNGIGIPAKDYKQVFEPFHRLHGDTTYVGTGLGLATCRRIVEHHGGSISCESVEGHGTTFFFTLPGA